MSSVTDNLRCAAPEGSSCACFSQLIRVRYAAEIAFLTLALPLSPLRQRYCDRPKSGVEEILALKDQIGFSFPSQTLNPQKNLKVSLVNEFQGVGIEVGLLSFREKEYE